MNQSENVHRIGQKIRSKPQAAALFNGLAPLRVRTIDPQNEVIMQHSYQKMNQFRLFLSEKASPAELMILGEFLDQGEFAEEVLLEAYR